MYFNVTIKFDKYVDGKIKPVKEQYLFDCFSFVEAETKALEKLAPLIFTIDAIKRTRISEIFNPESDKFYLCKVAFVTLDEKSGQEKRSIVPILVGAQNFGEACDLLVEGMKQTISDWDIVSVAESPILEYFPT